MGPPGAGKGTQAKRLVEAFGMAHLSSGDIFRAERASGSALGEKLAGYMDAGELVPDELVVEIMAKAVQDNDGPTGLMLDGFPRTVAQAEALDEQLASAKRPLDAVVVIRASDAVVVERITGRRSCPECGKLYHMTFMPPADDSVCDDCGVALTQREDDTEDVVRQRLAAYRQQTEPVVDYYRRRGEAELIEIDGDKAPDDVSQDITAALNNLPLGR